MMFRPTAFRAFLLMASLLAIDLQASRAADAPATKAAAKPPKPATFTKKDMLNAKDDGYRGIWYCVGKQADEYAFKYSGGLGTYCSSHNPFAVYCPEVDKTFFCYGGAEKDAPNRLVHMVSYYDHKTGMVPRPTMVLNKRTSDAHDNPVMSVDAQGHIWLFSSAHGNGPPACISKSKRPYDIDQFELVWTGNFSYPQVYHLPEQGFLFLQSNYAKDLAAPDAIRKLYFSTSFDGKTWTDKTLYGGILQGHYQVSWTNGRKVGSAFNHHPIPGGLDRRTNLYYLETADFGKTWQTASGEPLTIPLKTTDNPALIHDYAAKGLNVYGMDLNFDANGRPVILYLTSQGPQSGPKNDPRVWHTAYWTGQTWDLQGSIRSDNNYDMGSLWIEDGLWRIIGPTEPGPQRYNTGGEIAMWTSADQGHSWQMARQLTSKSRFNHGYCRRPVNARPDFYALWADGDARTLSESRIFFCDRDGNVRMLPTQMDADYATPPAYVPGR